MMGNSVNNYPELNERVISKKTSILFNNISNISNPGEGQRGATLRLMSSSSIPSTLIAREASEAGNYTKFDFWTFLFCPLG